MKKLYSFRDRVSGVYSAPFIGERNEAVIRGVRLAIAKGGDQPWQVFPRDNELYVVANYDECTGKVYIDEKSPEFVCNVSDLLEE